MAGVAARVNKWLKGFQKYLFFYRNGFFELPYLSNSPEIMLESLRNMPVTKYNPLEQAIYSNNPFTKGVMRYRELEEGLWLLVTQITFKSNVHTRALYDEEPTDYYFMSFSIYSNEVPLQNTVINKIDFHSKYWSLYRPGTEIDAYHYKGTSGLFFNFVFSKSWMEKNLSLHTLGSKNQLKKFLDSDTGFICWKDLVPEAELLTLEIWNNLEKENDGHFNTITVKIQTLKIITDFFKAIFALEEEENELPISDADRRTMAKVEKIMREHLSYAFPGIERIAKMVHMSPTKLKATFKAVYGLPMLQYYNERKMLLAKELILHSDMSIKNVSMAVGYESAGKFTSAFKKQFGKLPSEFKEVNSIV